MLIRLARQEADARRLAVAQAEHARIAQEAHLAAQDAQMAAEAERAREGPDSMALWSRWIGAARRERQKREQALLQAHLAEEAAREALREEFARMKRLEIAQQQHEDAARLVAARKAEQRSEETEMLKRQGR
ncbi:hypothetical protein NON00_08305 [Roseomonas sp. GC11]|uniref:hypothetical protein n=1 Tax=Roseomonas sp. GC11 TaxID=2950546 RepID=UPI00210943EA|nr:hypothetical protein [Roseomonas sp. GC11]MCQ4159930.1 hypothetical protein [Roseomonas sp. GC11]